MVWIFKIFLHRKLLLLLRLLLLLLLEEGKVIIGVVILLFSKFLEKKKEKQRKDTERTKTNMIHGNLSRDGDLSCSAAAAAASSSSSSSSDPMDCESILHRIEIPAKIQNRMPFSLASRFDLGVGGEGIVGRRVSLIRDHLLVGQGIVGWN